MRTVARLIISLFLVIFIASCAKIPPEAPELSSSLGTQIAQLEQTHNALVSSYFQLKRDNVITFIDERWIPLYTKDYLSNKKTELTWEKMSTSYEGKMLFMMRTGTNASAAIARIRNELIKPIDDLERLVKEKTKASYDQAKATNNAITSFLISASEISEGRQRYLDLIGVTDEKVTKLITDTDVAIATLLRGAITVDNTVDKASETISTGKIYLEQMKAILNSVETGEM